MPHVRQAVAQKADVEATHQPIQSKKSNINARPAALLKAWRCLSGALFAGALASPVAAELQIPQFGDDRDSLKLHQSSGGGSAANKYYLGLGGGVSRIEPEGVSNGFSADDVSSQGAKVFFGKYFLPQWRWEVGYTDAGEVGFRNPASAPGDTPTASHQIPSIAIDYLFRKPSSKLNFYLRGGAALLQYDSNDSRIQFEDESEVSGLLGAGMQWRLGDKVEARLGVESYGGSSAFASLSLATRLGSGQNKRPQQAVVVEPEASKAGPSVDAGASTQSAAESSAEEPNSSAKNTQTAHEAMCKSVDRELSGVSFEVGSAVLSVDSKRQLDRVANALKRGPNIRVTVRGYTDSDGEAHKNQLLSQKRAQAVGRYLMMAVGNFNNPPRAVGMGESNPIASNDTAAGRARNRRIELNLRAGDGCETASIIEEVDDKTRVSAENPDNSTFQSQLPTAAALKVPDVVPGSSISATYGSDKQACRVINQVVKGLNFDMGDHRLDGRSKRALMPILAALRNDSSLRLQVTGHTDSVGKRDKNQLLSELRAKSVANYLMIQAPETAFAASYIGQGELSPVESNMTPEGRAANRRIEIAITGGRNCHLPVEQTANIFAPANPVAKHRVAQPAVIKEQQNKPLDEIAVASTAIAPAQTIAPEPLALVAEQHDDLENDIEVLPAATEHGLTQEEAHDLAQVVAVENDVEPMTQSLEQEPNSSTSTLISPIAEPTLSDSIDLNGGTQAIAGAQSCSIVSRVISGVQFGDGEAVLNRSARSVLDPVVQLLRRDPAISVVVEGHTDNSGTARENMALSERRAKAVAAYLAGGAGMIKNPPLALGYGESQPMYGNGTAEGRLANRRIVLKLDGGRGCLSNELLAEIPGFDTEAAVLPAETQSAPAALALNAASESFVEAVGRMSRGHGACGVQTHVVDNIGFNSGDHRLDIEDQRALMPLVTLWRENPELSIEVFGHTDDAGSARGNRRLSQKRAESVAQFLMFEAGLVENAVVATGLGESKPRASNATAEGRQLNRRIEVLVNGGHKCDDVAALVPEATFTAPVFLEEEFVTQPEIADVEIAAIEVDDQEVLDQEIIALAQVAVALPVEVEAPQLQTVSGGGSAANEALLSCGETELMHTDVKFDTGAFFLNDQSRQALSAVVDLLRTDPEMQVEVQGHTDNVGTEKRNLTLSERRAEAVAQYLLHATNNLSNPPIAVGYGADLPLADNEDADGRAVNRRIDILLSGNPNCDLAANDADYQEADEEEFSNEWALPALQLAQLGDHTTRSPEQCVALQRVVEDLNFEPAGFRLNARAKNALAPVIEVLRKDPSMFIEVYGYSADYGNSAFDHVLAERRAEAVADYLMVKSGNFDNLPVAVGFGDLGGDIAADSSSSLYRANRIELRLSKGIACEQPVTNGINIRRPIQRMETASAAVATEAQLVQGGGGEKPVVAALVAANDSCEAHSRVLDSVAFDAGSYHLDDSSKTALNQIAETLAERPELSYEVHGHTDARGDERANLALSEWRARSVADYLARATGQWPTVANAEGYGESRPLASNDSISGRSINRRIELQLINKNC